MIGMTWRSWKRKDGSMAPDPTSFYTVQGKDALVSPDTAGFYTVQSNDALVAPDPACLLRSAEQG